MPKIPRKKSTASTRAQDLGRYAECSYEIAKALTILTTAARIDATPTQAEAARITKYLRQAIESLELVGVDMVDEWDGR